MKPAIAMPEIVSKVRGYMQAQGMPAPPEGILVALSGGCDSVALLRLLQVLDYKVAAVHCNHGLRPESMGEEVWVRALCDRLGTPLYVHRFGPADFERYPGAGVQHAARQLRYAAFQSALKESGLTFCATGHHADDQLETRVMSFFRGNGPQMIHSIPAVRHPYLRPLLGVTKSELVTWLESLGQDWCHDGSNDHPDYRRNLFRLELLPLLERIDQRYAERFSVQAERLQLQQAFLARQFSPIATAHTSKSANGILLDLHGVTESLGGEDYLPVFLDWFLAVRGFGGTAIHCLQRLAHSQVGAIFLHADGEVRHTQQGLLFLERIEEARQGSLWVQAPAEGVEVEWGSWHVSLGRVPRPTDFVQQPGMETHWMDPGALRWPLQLRHWQHGDRMQPLGLKGTKLLSDIFVDLKWDQEKKGAALVIEDADGIVLLGGFRIAARLAVGLDRDWCWCIRLHRQP